MPCITTERVAEIRAQIKKEFPTSGGWKFSITREHYSSINVSILSAPFNLLPNSERQHEQVNHYYINEHYKNNPAVKDVLLRLYAIMNEGNRTISEDGDYGSIPAFYCNISIGQYDKPFQVVKGKEQKTFEKAEVQSGKVQIIAYSEKAIAVIGDTYPLKDKLKAMGGKFNKFLSCGAGWIFRKSDLEVIKNALTTNVNV